MQREEETSSIYLLACLLYSFFLAGMQNPAFSGDPYFYVQQYVVQYKSEANRTFDKRLKESKDFIVIVIVRAVPMSWNIRCSIWKRNSPVGSLN